MKKIIEQYLTKHGFEAFTPKAVLFDMDGVLFDSMPNHARSWHESMKQCGIQMDRSEAYEYEGMRGVETIRLKAREQWHREISEEEAQQIYDKKAKLFAACPPAPKMAGVENLMQHIKNCGLRIGVVTGSGQHTLLDKLEHSFPELLRKEYIVTSFDVKHGKPAPEPYLAGLHKLGIEPWEAMVVENAPLGVRAAVAARIFTIAVNTGPLPDQRLQDEGASLVLHSMDELTALLPQLLTSEHLNP